MKKNFGNFIAITTSSTIAIIVGNVIVNKCWKFNKNQEDQVHSNNKIDDLKNRKISDFIECDDDNINDNDDKILTADQLIDNIFSWPLDIIKKSIRISTNKSDESLDLYHMNINIASQLISLYGGIRVKQNYIEDEDAILEKELIKQTYSSLIKYMFDKNFDENIDDPGRDYINALNRFFGNTLKYFTKYIDKL